MMRTLLIFGIVVGTAIAAGTESKQPDAPDAPVQTASAQGELLDEAMACRPAQAIPFELPDQFKNTHTLVFPREKPVVLGIADRHGADQVLKWYYPLHKAYGDELDYVAVGAMHTLPGVLAPIIRHFLRKDVDKPIYLDWHGDVVKAYHYEEKISNLFVIDCGGRVLIRIDGPRTDEGIAKVKAVLDELLKPKEEIEKDDIE